MAHTIYAAGAPDSQRDYAYADMGSLAFGEESSSSQDSHRVAIPNRVDEVSKD